MKKSLLLLFALFCLSLSVSAQWTIIPSGTTAKIDAIHFIDSNVGYVSGGFTDTRKTTDGGNSWSIINTRSIRDFSYTDASFGYGASRVGESMSRTTNGGDSWTDITPPTSNSLWAVSATSATTAYFSGTGGVIWKTTTGGSSVTVQNSGTTRLLTDIFFTNSTTGYLAVQLAEIKKSTNSGVTWNTIYNVPGGPLLTEMHFVNENLGYVVGSGGTVVKTENAGATWTVLDTGSTSYLQGVHFLNENLGIVVGSGGTILLTQDGGTSWQQQPSGTTEILYDVRVISPTAAVVVGDEGLILKNDNFLSIGENNLSVNLNVLPNPFFNSIQVSSKNELIEAVKIYNVSGQLVFNNSNVSSIEYALDASQLSKGMYMVEVQTASGNLFKKLVK